MTFISAIRNFVYQPEIQRRIQRYQGMQDREEIAAWQLQQFNQVWQQVSTQVPYYHRLLQDGKVPQVFSSWQEFYARMPITDKAVFQKQKREMTNPSRKPDYFQVSSGSTAQPIQLPAWNSEFRHTRFNQWIGRAPYGITPADRCLFLASFSHVMGTGYHAAAARQIRILKDLLLGYSRTSIVNLSSQRLEEILHEIRKTAPDYIVGYSVSIDLLARFALNHNLSLSNLKMKAVVATGENLPADDSRAVIESAFQAPLVIEYGAIETNALAYSNPAGGFDIFWQQYFFEIDQDPQNDRQIVRITSLYPRCFPLIRYELGDVVATAQDLSQGPQSVAHFEKAIGRTGDLIQFPDGTQLHSAAVLYAVHIFPQVLSFQLFVDGDQMRLNLITDLIEIPPDLAQSIRSRLVRVEPRFQTIEICKALKLKQGRTGKIPLIIQGPFNGDEAAA